MSGFGQRPRGSCRARASAGGPGELAQFEPKQTLLLCAHIPQGFEKPGECKDRVVKW